MLRDHELDEEQPQLGEYTEADEAGVTTLAGQALRQGTLRAGCCAGDAAPGTLRAGCCAKGCGRGQRPVKVAWPGPFSRKLRMPAFWSSVPNSAANCTRSISRPVARSTPRPASMACLAARSASAGPLA